MRTRISADFEESTDKYLLEPANARSSAREKLTRLTKQQFQELSTDVYDELMRRKNNSENEGEYARSILIFVLSS